MADAETPPGPSPADVWFSRKMALHEDGRVASWKARQAEVVQREKRTAIAYEAGRRIDSELEWNRARVRELRAAVDEILAPRRASRDTKDPTAQHKHKQTGSMFVSYAPNSTFHELAATRAIVDAVNSTGESESRNRCWLDLDVLPMQELNDVQSRQLYRADALGESRVILVIGGTTSYEQSPCCQLERRLLSLRLEAPEFGGDGDECLVIGVNLGSFFQGKYPYKGYGDSGYWDGLYTLNTGFIQFVQRYEDSVQVIDQSGCDDIKVPPLVLGSARRFDEQLAETVKQTVTQAIVFLPRESTVRLDTHTNPNTAHQDALDALDALKMTSTYRAQKNETSTSATSITWANRHVVEWVRSLGGWTASVLLSFQKEKTHGSSMSALNHDVLRVRFGVSDTKRRTLLLSEIEKTFPKLVVENKMSAREYQDEEAESDRGAEDAIHKETQSTSLSNLFVALKTTLHKKLDLAAKGGSVTVSERDAFVSLFHALNETFLKSNSVDIEPGSVSNHTFTDAEIRRAFLLAACDAERSRSETLPRRVEWRGFEEAALKTLTDELSIHENKNRQAAVIALEADGAATKAKNTISNATLGTKILLRAAFETKLRGSGVAFHLGRDEKLLDDDNEVMCATAAIDDLVCDKLLSPECAAGVRASAHTFNAHSMDKQCEVKPDDFVAEWVDSVFAKHQKSYIDFAVSVAQAKENGIETSKLQLESKREMFETTRILTQKKRTDHLRTQSLEDSYVTIQNSISPIEAFRHAAAVCCKFLPDLVDEEDGVWPKVAAYVAVVSRGSETRTRALKVFASSVGEGNDSKPKSLGSEIRAWESDLWPAVGMEHLYGPLVMRTSDEGDATEATDATNDNDKGDGENTTAPVVVDSPHKFAVPLFAVKDHCLDESETPRGVLVVETSDNSDNSENSLSHSQKEVVKKVASAVSDALSSFTIVRKNDRENLKSQARALFESNTEAREQLRQQTLELLEEKRKV